MDFLNDIFSNHIFNIAFIAWISAQLIKVTITFIRTKKFSVERLFGAGGMPSAHSSTVCSLVISTARVEGVSSSIFAISVILACIVMYDAMGVRRAAGEHAKVINFFVAKHNNEEESDNSIDKKLKEFLGHTPIEVIGGCVLGVLIAYIYPI